MITFENNEWHLTGIWRQSNLLLLFRGEGGGGEGRGGHTLKDFSPTLGTPLNNVYKCRLSGLLFNEGNKLSSILVKFLTFCLGFQLVAIYFQC